MNPSTRWLAGCALALLSVPALAQSTFDGNWFITLACDDVKTTRGISKGYTFQFEGTIAGGVLQAQQGTPGTPGFLSLAGRVGADGTLSIVADGLTGDPGYAVGAPAPDSRYGYRMTGRLDDGRGVAHRVEVRPCQAVFTKR